MQILDAADHGELAAEISATNVNRIALAGDRIAKVVRSPDGFAVELDAASGDIYLRPAGAPPATPEAAGFESVTLFIGTEKGFTYRLTLMPVARASAQILIRNADAVPAATAFAVSPSAGEPHVAALVRLVRAVARRAPLPGTAIQAGGGSLAAGIRLIETWRGPRFAALVFEAARPVSEDADGAVGLAGNVPIGLALFASLTSQVGDGLRNGAETISGLCGTRVVLAAPDRDTAQWSADSLGRSEIEEVSEGFSYGANTIRRGRIGS